MKQKQVIVEEPTSKLTGVKADRCLKRSGEVANKQRWIFSLA